MINIAIKYHQLQSFVWGYMIKIHIDTKEKVAGIYTKPLDPILSQFFHFNIPPLKGSHRIHTGRVYHDMIKPKGLRNIMI